MKNGNTYPEKYWHCSVSSETATGTPKRSVVNDLSLGQVETQIIRPWHENKTFTISGLVVSDKTKVSQIRLVQTEHPREQYAERHRQRMLDANIIDRRTDTRLLPFSAGTDYTHDILFSSLESPPPTADESLILKLCQRLPYAAKLLATRKRSGKTPFTISDEYDVQDLLHAIIRCYLKYSVQEEPLGKVVGTLSSRADIAIEELGVLIELKYVHGPSDQSRILNEFSQDLLLYTKWVPLKTCIYVIYNSGDLRDPEAFEKLSGKQEVNGKVFTTKVVLV